MDTKEILQKSQHISVQLPQEAAQKDVQAASTIMCGLRELGKDVRLERKKSAPPHSFAVSLRGLAPKIAKVQYEKDKEDVHLYFTLQEGEISQEQTDLTIIVGQDNSWGKAVLELLAQQESPQARLLGRLLQKLEYTGSMHTSSIQQRDFQETGSTPKTLVQTVSKIKEDFGSQLSYFFIFETANNGKSQALLWTSQESIKARLLPVGVAQQKGGWALYTIQASSQQLHHAITN